MDAVRTYMAATAFAVIDLDAELARARAKFPAAEHSYAALLEDLGELANALLEHKYGHAPARNVRAEALQVACMAMRVGSEGDASYGLVSSEDVHAATERLGCLACERLDQLRAGWPGNRHALARLSRAVTKIGELLIQSEHRTWRVAALESAATHAIAWALRVAIEGDAGFPYTASAEYGI